MSEFDIKAAEWDSNPMQRERSEAIADKIKKILPLKKNMSALEYGAGTGVASFLLKDYLKKITLMDNSTEMVKIIEEKIRSGKVKNLKVINFDLEQNDYKSEKFDLIFNQMVLHHVTDTESIIHKFGELINPGGYLAIADLYKEDGSFHEEGFKGHNGFDPEKLADIMKRNHFINISHVPCFVITRKLPDDVSRNFKVFLLTGRLPETK